MPAGVASIPPQGYGPGGGLAAEEIPHDSSARVEYLHEHGTSCCRRHLAGHGSPERIGPADAGETDSVGTQPFRAIATYDGTAWSALGAGLASSRGRVSNPLALFSSGNDLYVAGLFDSAGAQPASGIAVWDGTAWHALGHGLQASNGIANSIASYGSRIVVGGAFQFAGQLSLASWDGARWGSMHPAAVTLASSPAALIPQGDALLAVAPFVTSDDDMPHYRVGRWDGTSWSLVGPSLQGNVSTSVLWRGQIVASGDFDSLGAERVGGLARLDGDSWKPRGEGVDGDVSSFAAWNNRLIAGGSFSHARGQPASSVAAWDGSQWTAFPGLVGEVTSLQVYAGNLVATGDFTVNDDANTESVAQWDGARWSSLDADLAFGTGYAQVQLSTIWNDRLVVSGEFTHASGASANGLAAWDGLAWRPVALPCPAWIEFAGSDQGRPGGGGRSRHRGPAPDGVRWRAVAPARVRRPERCFHWADNLGPCAVARKPVSGRQFRIRRPRAIRWASPMGRAPDP